MKRWLSGLGWEVAAGTRAAFPIGVAAGLLLTAVLASLDGHRLLFSEAGAVVWLALLLAAAGALGTVSLLLPLELLVSLRDRGRARGGGGLAYATAAVVGLACLHVLLWWQFNVVRDRGSTGNVLLTLALVGLPVATFFVVPCRRGNVFPPSTRRTWPVIAAVLVLAAAIPVALTRLDGQAGLSPRSLGPEAGGAAVRAIPPVKEPRINVIIVSIDTLRADRVGAYGYDRPTTPNLDRLGRDAIVFHDARAQAPWTLPSHATLFTSLYPAAHGARSTSNSALAMVNLADRLPASRTTLAERLRAAGWRTGAFVRLRWLTSVFGMDQGFDTLIMRDRGSAEDDVAIALDWISDQQGAPFFLFLHSIDVHQFSAPASFRARFVDGSYGGRLAAGPLETSINGYESLDGGDVAYLNDRYDAAVAYTDAALGRLFDGLSAAGVSDRTLIVVTSDHGEELWDRGGTGHGFTLYDDQLRVPLIVKPPGGLRRAAGAHVRVDAGLIDVVPTVLEYAGLPACTECEGVSLARAWTSGRPIDRPLFAEDTYFHNTSAVVQRGYKYIANDVPPVDPFNLVRLFDNVRTFYRFRRPELFDLRADPGERQNVIEQHPELAETMGAELVRHLRGRARAERFALDPASVDELRSLGYVH